MCRDLYPRIEEKCLFSVRAKMLLFLHIYGYGCFGNNSINNFTLVTCVQGFGRQFYFYAKTRIIKLLFECPSLPFRLRALLLRSYREYERKNYVRMLLIAQTKK